MEGHSAKTIGKYRILRTLGTGGTCKVKLGLDTESNKQVAVKIIKSDLGQDVYKYVMAEVEAMQALNHKNILNQIEYGTGIYEKPNGKSREVTYIVLELAEVGDLFDVVANSGAFPEELTRYYMRRFLEGLQYCHNRGIVHRDIKIENCLLDKDFEIKINDFGFAAPTEGRDGSGELYTKLGTECNMAPELLAKKPYQGASVDLFATAIVAFTMISQHPPFHKAAETDYYYKFIAKNHTRMFWDKHSGSKDRPDFYSEEFKDLFNSCVQADPTHRPTIGEVLSHPWFMGPEPTEDQVAKELESRLGSINEARDEARRQRREARGGEDNIDMSDGNMRSADIVAQIQGMRQRFDPNDLQKKIKTVELGPYQLNNTCFFSDTSPDIIELVMRNWLDEAKFVHTVDDGKYKTKFTVTGKNVDGDDYEVVIKMQMLQYNDTTVYVEFQKVAGLQLNFLKHYKELVQGTKVMKDGDTVTIPGPLTVYDNQIKE